MQSWLNAFKSPFLSDSEIAALPASERASATQVAVAYGGSVALLFVLRGR